MTATAPTIGLALGAGGARGLAHVVLLEVLAEMGLSPVAIAGASMGAVIGAGAAAGMRPKDIRAHCLRVLRSRRALLAQALDARVGRFADLLRRGLVNPVLLDAELFLPFLWPAEIPTTFEALALPLTVIATDFDGRRALAIESGDLLSAVAGSVAIPGLVRPVPREGLHLIDGGTINPLPYEALAGRADCLIACDVATGPIEPLKSGFQAVGVMLGAAQIMQAALTARMLAAKPPHLLIRPPVERFRLLDVFHAARIFEAADAGREAMKRDIDRTVEVAIRRRATG